MNAFTKKPESDKAWIAAQKRSENAKPGGRKRSSMEVERITSKRITPRKKGTYL